MYMGIIATHYNEKESEQVFHRLVSIALLSPTTYLKSECLPPWIPSKIVTMHYLKYSLIIKVKYKCVLNSIDGWMDIFC